MKLFRTFIDKYLAYPILLDAILITAIWFLSKNLSFFCFIFIDKNNQISIMSNIINADVSLAGFILAALTIIVTFKSNIQSKGIEESTNALELIFSSKHYSNIVNVFKKSLIELILCSIIILISWTASDNLSIRTINRINVSGIIITTLSIFRSLFILFILMDLDKNKQSK